MYGTPGQHLAMLLNRHAYCSAWHLFQGVKPCRQLLLLQLKGPVLLHLRPRVCHQLDIVRLEVGMYACVNSADPGCQYLLQALVIMLKGIQSHLLNQHAELFTSLSNTILVEERYSRSAPSHAL